MDTAKRRLRIQRLIARAAVRLRALHYRVADAGFLSFPATWANSTVVTARRPIYFGCQLGEIVSDDSQQ